MSSNPVTVTLRLTPTDPAAFARYLAEILPDTRKAHGCRSSKTFVENGGAEFLLLQEWDSQDDQQTYLAWREETGVLQTFLGQLAKPAEVIVWNASAA